MTGYEHLILPKDKFWLLTSEAEISVYQFNQGIAKHYSCAVCVIKSFYVPRSNPDDVSVNFRCVDKARFNLMK
jgi:hypothetical protein